MLPHEDEAELLALQEEVRAAAALTGRLRSALRWSPGTGLFLFLAGGGLLLAAADPSTYGTAILFAGPAGLVLGAGLGLLSALPLAALHRWSCRARIQRGLGDLPPERLADALRPLEADTGADVRKLVAPLLRHCCPRATELLPAAAPAARGSELAAPGTRGEPELRGSRFA